MAGDLDQVIDQVVGFYTDWSLIGDPGRWSAQIKRLTPKTARSAGAMYLLHDPRLDIPFQHMHGLLLSPDTYALRDSFCPYTNRLADNGNSGSSHYERMREHCTAVYTRVLLQRPFQLRRSGEGGGLAAALQTYLLRAGHLAELNIFRELLGCRANKSITLKLRQRVHNDNDLRVSAEPLVRAVLELLQDEVLRRNPSAKLKAFAAAQGNIVDISSRRQR